MKEQAHGGLGNPTTITTHSNLSKDLEPSAVYLLLACKDYGDFCIEQMRFRKHEKGKSTRKKQKRAFKHAVSIALVYKDCQINVKISKNKFQMVGVKRRGDLRIITELLLKQLNGINGTLKYMKKHPEKTERTIRLFYKAICGDPVLIKNEVVLEMRGRGPMVTESKVIDNDLKEVCLDTLAEPPKGASRSIWALLLRASLYELEHRKSFFFSVVKARIEYIVTLNSLLEENKLACSCSDSVCACSRIEMTSELVDMMNFNYKLGFRINRNIVASQLDAKESMIARFDALLADDVKIKVLDEELDRWHTFMLYSTGSATQSGPGGRRMKLLQEQITSYILENQEMFENRNDITFEELSSYVEILE